MGIRFKGRFIPTGMVRFANVPVVFLPPLFTNPPSIDPQAGILGSTTFTGNDGAFIRGTVSQREWLINGTVVGLGPTFQPSTTGNLVYRVTVTGNGGTVTAESTPASVELPEPPTWTQNPTVSPASAKMGSTFTANEGSWTGATGVTREWLINGKVVTGATTNTIVPMKVGSLVYRITLTNLAGSVVRTTTPVEVLVDPVIAQPPTWDIQTGYVGSFAEGTAFSESFSASDENGGPMIYEVVGGELPPGLSLNLTTGNLFGTIGAVEDTTTFNFRLRATDDTNLFIEGDFEIQIQNVMSNVFWDTPEGNLGEPEAGSSFSARLSARSV